MKRTYRLEDLHNYQKAIVKHVIENPAALEMVKMGLGKHQAAKPQKNYSSSLRRNKNAPK